MTKILKVIKVIGAGVTFWMWGTLGYKLGYEACVRDTSYNDLASENAKLKEELENKEI